MLFDRSNWPRHRPWALVFLAGIVVSLAWFWVASRGEPDWPGGSSLPGFTFGVIGGLIIVFEFLLWVRKKLRVWRIGRAQTWLQAHIWLGLLCLPLLILHSGLRLGGYLSTTLMVLLVIVILSGVWGLILQNLLPKRMLEEIPAETIYSQMDYLAEQLLNEGRQLVEATSGVAAGEALAVGAGVGRRDEEGHQVVGAIRSVGGVQGKVVKTRALTAPIPNAEALAAFFKDQVGPFLKKGSAGNTLLANPTRAAVLFQNMKAQLPFPAHETLATLADFVEQRRQWETQAKLHYWLHNWLWVHFPLSVALLVLMGLHVWVTLRFW